MKKLFILFLWLSFNAYAQEFKLSGMITGENQMALPGAVIEIEENAQKTTSDYEGFFNLKLPVGNYHIKVSYTGFETVILPVKLQKDSFVRINLNPKAEKLGTVIVQAVKATNDMPVTQTNISQKSLQEQNLGQDVPYLIEMTPSVVVTSDAGAGVGYTGIRIRGISPQQINVTLNGVPLNDPESHSVYWVDVPDFAGSTESLQIQRGVGTSTFGSGAFGASINLETDRVSKVSYAQIQSSYGSFNTQKYSIKGSTGLLNKHFEFTGRYSKILSDGYIDRASSDLNSFYVSGTYKDEKNTLKAIVFGGSEVTYQAWYGVDKETFETNPTFNYAGAIYDDNWNVVDYYDNQIDNYKQDHYQLHFKRLLGENLFFNLTAHYTYGRGYYEQYKQAEDFADYGFAEYDLAGTHIAQTDLIRRKWLDNDFYGIVASVQYKSDDHKIIIGLAKNEYDGRHFGRIIWTEKALNVDYNQEYYNNTGIKKTTSGFAKSLYQITDDLSLFTDIQFRKIDYSINGTLDWQYPFKSSDDLFFINPKIGLYYKPGYQHQFYVSLAQTHREPNRDDYVNNAPQMPKSETLNDAEMGWKYQNDKLRSEVNLYGMFYKDQLVLTGKIDNVGNPIRENVGESYRTGIETQIAYQLSRDLELSGNLTFSDNRNVDYKITDGTQIINYGNTYLTYSPSVVGAGVLRWKPVENLKLDFTGKYVGKQYMDNRNIPESELEAYWTANFLATYHLTGKAFKNMEFSFKLNNIFDRKYASNGYMWGDTPYYYPQAGRNFLAGVNIRF